MLTLVDQRTAHAREVVKIVRSSLSGQVNVFETEVRLHVALKETAKAGRSILDYDSHSPQRRSLSTSGARGPAVCGEPLPRCCRLPSVSQVAKLARAASPGQARAPTSREPVRRARRHRACAEAPQFETFVVEGWQQWLGAPPEGRSSASDC